MMHKGAEVRSCARGRCLWSQRRDRPPILARYLSTYASGMYRRRPVPSVKYVLKMLKSCENRSGEEGRRPLSVPGSGVCVPPPDGAPRVRDNPLTLEISPAVTGRWRLADSGAPPIMHAWCALGRLWRSERRSFGRARCRDFGPRTKGSFGIGGHLSPRTSPF